jgi:hypothetical protein
VKAGFAGARACPLERRERCERLPAGAQTCAATDRNCIESRGSRGELAQDSEAHRYGAYGKCSAGARKHRVLTWGDLIGARGLDLSQEQCGPLLWKKVLALRQAAGRRRANRAVSEAKRPGAAASNRRRQRSGVSRSPSRWPGVGRLKGRTTKHKEQT